jgi:hypothetical protein
MISNLNSVLSGAVAMASFVVTLFFLRFWRQTRDSFFLLFAIAFGLDAVAHVLLGLSGLPAEVEPFFYLARLVTFGIIIAAIAQKNNSGTRRR